ncbi:hypothetical protein B0H10DRAFT_1944734 [Mycena sp. CBHHK59/15]|nr:hypothetical protein B0H10DRAFT_1944734 [Mycena sp. CBHHK59/15]
MEKKSKMRIATGQRANGEGLEFGFHGSRSSHVLLAACAADESAYEGSDTGRVRGAFTTALTRQFDILESQIRIGTVTYCDLCDGQLGDGFLFAERNKVLVACEVGAVTTTLRRKDPADFVPVPDKLGWNTGDLKVYTDPLLSLLLPEPSSEYPVRQVDVQPTGHIALHASGPTGILTIERMDRLITTYAVRDIRIPPDSTNPLPFILNGIAHFHFHLGPSWNFYGIKIVNESSYSLYPYLFFFDPSDYSIEALYLPSFTAVTPPLGPKGFITVGYDGEGGALLCFKPQEGVSDASFLKLIVSTKNINLDYISQSSPFETPSALWTTIHLNDITRMPVAVWSTDHIFWDVSLAVIVVTASMKSGKAPKNSGMSTLPFL